MSRLRIAVPTVSAAIVGFLGGFFVTAGVVENRRYPDGCDGPCVFLASDVWNASVIGGLVTALVLGLGVGVLVWRGFARPS